VIGLDPRVAISRYPCLAALATLISSGSGWLFLPPLVLGGVECLFGARQGPVVTETITVRSPDDVTVARLRSEDFRIAVYGAAGVLWEFSGTLEEAVAQLSDLPADEHPDAPRLLLPRSSA
jgi:hypothetical protein